MSAKDISGISLSEVLAQASTFDLKSASFNNEDYFLWSRFDGKLTLGEVVRDSGFDNEKATEVLTRLIEAAALSRNGEPLKAPTAGGKAAAGKAIFRGTSALTTPLHVPTISTGKKGAYERVADPSEQEQSLLEADCALSEQQKHQVIHMLRRCRSGDHFVVLGVDVETKPKGIKRAYFLLSKQFHPDRFYGRDTADFAPILSDIFRAITTAFEVLSQTSKRARYLAATGRGDGLHQSKQEHARDLFQRGSILQSQGRHEDAIKFYNASYQSHPSPKPLRRATDCALAIRDFALAERLARQSMELCPRDPSYMRLVGNVLAAKGDIDGAIEVLTQALDIPTENDALVSELIRDVDDLRRKKSQ